MTTITSELIERAEGQLTFGMQVAADRSVDSDMLYSRADARRDTVDNFVGHLMIAVVRQAPSLKPKHRAAVATVIRHALLVGMMAGRQATRLEVERPTVAK